MVGAAARRDARRHRAEPRPVRRRSRRSATGGGSRSRSLYALAVALYLLALHQDELDANGAAGSTPRRPRRSQHAGRRRARRRRRSLLVAAIIGAASSRARAATPWFDYRALGDGDGGGLLNADDADRLHPGEAAAGPEREVFTVDIGDAEPRVLARDRARRVRRQRLELNDTGEPADELEPPSEPPTTEELEQTVHDHRRPIRTGCRPPTDPSRVSTSSNALSCRDSATLYLKSDDADRRPELRRHVRASRTDVAEQLRGTAASTPTNASSTSSFPASFPDGPRPRGRRHRRRRHAVGRRPTRSRATSTRPAASRTTTKSPATHSIDRSRSSCSRPSEGYCEQFASAFAAMARSIGLPTRVAVGYTYGTPSATASWHRARTAMRTRGRRCTSPGSAGSRSSRRRSGSTTPSGTGDPRAAPVPAAAAIPVPTVTTTTVAPGACPDLTLPTRDPDQNLDAHRRGVGRRQHRRRRTRSASSSSGSCSSRGAPRDRDCRRSSCLVVRAVRRTWRRRHAPDPRDRVLGAWAQALDHLAEAGRRAAAVGDSGRVRAPARTCARCR